jgi:serine/threonine protein kinase
MIVLEKYKLIEEIGKGGMGLVYKAEDQKVGRIVAIKELILPKDIKDSEKILSIERFKRESQVGYSLNHPNIVRFFDFGQENDRHFIAMEFLKGENLKDFIISNSLDNNQLIQIFIQIAQGLEFAHNNNIIHRDIKPANIQVLPNNKVKITDFGIAKIKDLKSELTQDGTMFGTLAYISPEQIMNSKAVDHRADIYSFGALMYELITGKAIFEGDNIGNIIYKILHLNPQPLNSFKDNLPNGLENIILRCLEKDLEKRYQDSDSIINDLKKVINNNNSNKIIFNSNKSDLKNTIKINTLDSEILDTEKTTNINCLEMTRGQKIFIKDYIQADNFTIGFNWLYKNNSINFDLSAILLSSNEKLEEEDNFVFYNNLISNCGSIRLDQSENNLYKGVIDVDLRTVPQNISRIKFLINSDNDLSNLENIELMIISNKDKSLLYKIDDFSVQKTAIIAEIYKYKDEWKLQATGEGYNYDLESFLKKYIIDSIEIDNS